MRNLLTSAFCLAVLTASAFAVTLELPKDDGVYSVTVPDKWKPDETDHGFVCESPDEAATIIFEVVSAKKLEALIDQNLDWLKEHKVVIDQDSKTEKEFEDGAMKWSLLKYDGKDDEYGPATIMLAFGNKEGSLKVMMITYWVTKEGEAKYADQITEILNSVKPVEE